jgi:hypothetical protein
MHQVKLTDGRQIVVVERGGLSDLIRRQEKASVVLVNADEPFSQEFVEQLATLHDLGCHRFLCSGVLSERLHDAIDDRLLESEDAEVMTTFHGEDESLDDVVALFLELGLGQGSRLQIYVRGSSSQDNSILAKLKAASVE